MAKVLLLSDKQGHVVDRISEGMGERIKHDITIDYYTVIKPGDLVKKSYDFDIIHFNNSDQGRFLSVVNQIKIPMVMSIRSFRYPKIAESFAEFMTVNHVVNPELKKVFPNAYYIADPIFDEYLIKRDFVVGMAVQDNEWNKEYKGFYLVKEACEQLGVVFKPALSIPFDQMLNYYKSIDLLVSASIAEGTGTTVMEAMALNKPVITTDTGLAHYMNADFIERSVDGIKQGILRHYTYPQVNQFTWEVVANAFTDLYENIGKLA